jgi:ABC-2 type transport system ATP-binding protein|tara:strand:- start:2061 stop:3005 length:945 start_codon:yes stop_codon:yes gene_type:complete
MISVRGLNFEYPPQKILTDINFELSAGSVTALVGPNGAGKTTLLRCLTNLQAPLSGHIEVDGIDIHRHPRKAHRKMGYLSDFFGLYNDLSVRQCLTYTAWCQKLPKADVQKRVEAVAEDVEITSYLDKKAGSLSRGYRQRLGVGMAMIHDPKILILDEPASGLDPEARVNLSAFIVRLQKRGMTIIVSSHILAELEDYCTDMLVIRDGEIRSHVTLSQYQAEHQTAQVTRIEMTLLAQSTAHVELIAAHPEVSQCYQEGDGLHCDFTGDAAAQTAFLKYLIQHDVPVSRFVPMQRTLKSAYMDLAHTPKGEQSA